MQKVNKTIFRTKDRYFKRSFVCCLSYLAIVWISVILLLIIILNKVSMCNNLIEDKIKQLKDICKAKGMRVTPQRIAIFKEVAKSKQHPDVETIYNAVKPQMPNVSMDTIYRTLTSLEELGMIFRVDNQLPKARFDADKTPHYHFLCVSCNEVYDIFPKNDCLDLISADVANIGEVKDINIQIRGVCKHCLSKT